MDETTKKNTKNNSKVKKKSAPKTKAKTVVAPPQTKIMKTVQNTSLQSWPIPNGNGTILLVPGASVEIPAGAMTSRLINLHKRRLVSIR